MNDSGDPHRVLARNAACHQCRRRKLKCDAVRPTCGNCRKPRQRGPEKYEPPEACTWDEARDPSARTLRKREAKAARGIHNGKQPTGSPALWVASNSPHRASAPSSSAAGPSNSTQPPQPQPQPRPLPHQPAGAGLQAQQQASGSHSQFLDPRPLPVKIQHFQVHEPVNGFNGYSGGSGGGSAYAPPPMPSGISPIHPPPLPCPAPAGPNDPPPGSPPRPPPPQPPQSHGHYPNHNAWGEHSQPPYDTPEHMNGGVGYPPPHPQPQPQPQPYPGPPPVPNTAFRVPNAPPLKLNPQVSQVMYSDWPVDLPPALTVHHIADIFFARVRLVPKMFHRATFLANLALPPTHHNFPALALLHGIMAVTAPYIAPELLASRAYFPVGTHATAVVHPEYDFSPRSALVPASSVITFSPASIGDGSPLHRFQMWHRRKCYEHLSQVVSIGSHLIEAAQAVVAATWVDINNGWWSDVWVESGNAVRMSLPLNLNLSSKGVRDPLSHNIGSILREATSGLEQAQRDRVWWVIYLTERAASAGSLWPNAIADEDITVELPVAEHMFDNGIGDLVGVQSFESPDFYSHHPLQHHDTLCMYIKASRALADVLTFMRKYSRGLHTYQRFFSDPRFQQVFTNVQTLRQSLPPEFKTSITNTPHGPVVDADKYTVIDIIHCALITIGGPLIAHQTWMLPQARMILNEIRGVVSNYLNLSQTSFDITNLSAHCSFVWFQAGRNLIRFIHCASATNNPQARMEVAAFEADLHQLMVALGRLGERFPTAHRYAKVLEAIRAQPIEPVGEIIVLNKEENLFDSEYGANIPRKTPSTSSATMSPKTFHEVTPGGVTGAGGGSNSNSSPHAGVSPAIGTGSATAGPSQPQLQAQSQPSNGMYYSASAGAAGPPDDTKDFQQWFKTDFDVSTYSFDADAMSQLVTAHGPNVQFDGSLMAFPQQ